MADFAALRQRHSDHVLLSLLASTTARLLVSTMRTHHGAHERMGSLNKLLRALLASGDAAILSENIVKQMVRLLRRTVRSVQYVYVLSVGRGNRAEGKPHLVDATSAFHVHLSHVR